MPGESAEFCREWTDSSGLAWIVEHRADRIVLRNSKESIEISAANWPRDVYLIPVAGGVHVRFETFARTVVFRLSAEEAGPFLSRLAGGTLTRPVERAESAPFSTPSVSLLWPKVSSLSVWALISSAFVFVPGVGVLAGVVTIILLLLHRARVRRVAAYRHSRMICVAAFMFLILGAGVSILATFCLLRHGGDFDPANMVSGGETTERNWGMIAAGVFVILLSLSVHEAAHATSAWWLGDDYARSLGRVTLNPLSHIDPFGTIILPLMMAWFNGPIFGFARPVPVQVDNIRRRGRAHILISIAGPGSNMLLACASMLLLLAVGCGVALLAPDGRIESLAAVSFETPVEASGFALANVVGPFCTILRLNFLVNIFLAFFNMIPVPPLDGSWVLEHLFPRTLGRLYAAVRPYGFLVFILLLSGGAFDKLMIPVAYVLIPAFWLLGAATGS